MPQRDADPRSLLARHHETYEGILALAQQHLASSHELAAAWAEVAADHAWKCHPGFFVDQRLEQLLASLGTPKPSGAAHRISQSPQSVLHVLTEAHPIGGHTRLAWRWIELDRSRRHSVLLTRQPLARASPAQLTTAARNAGGDVLTLDWQRFAPLARAEQVRGLAADFDMVVVHAHPFDVVPAIAFACSGGPPVVLLNHASFAFWVGRDVADVVACLRPSSRDVAINRRAIHPSRCLLLPIPLERPAPGPTRSEARAALGVEQDAVVLFTVATPYKYLPFEPGPSFVELIESVALAYERACIFAIGPTDEGAWRLARERTGGRIRALGAAVDVDLYARATDVYLDSFPVTSPTSFLEVGRYGAPIASLNSYAARAANLCADDARADGLFVRTSPEGFVREVGRLIEDAPYRVALGRATADIVLAGHGPEAFAESLEHVYAVALRMRAVGRPVATEVGGHGSLDECLVRLQATAGQSLPVAQIAQRHLDAYPAELRDSVGLQASAACRPGPDAATRMER